MEAGFILSEKNIFYFTVVAILLNLLLYPNLFIVQTFCLIYTIIIYKKFSKKNIDMIYFLTLLFAIVGFSMKININESYKLYYYYIYSFIYMIYILKEVIKNTHNISLKKFYNKYWTFGLIFLVYMFSSVFITKNKIEAIKYIIMLSISFTLPIMILFQVKDKKQLRNTLNFLFILFIGVLAIGTFQIFGLSLGINNKYIQGMGIIPNNNFISHIPTTFFYNPNNYAVYLVMAMLGITVTYLHTEKNRILYLVTYMIAQINLIFSMSRTGWITLLISLLALFFLYVILSIKNKNNLLKIKEIAVLIFLTLLIFIICSFIPKMKSYYGKPSVVKYTEEYIDYKSNEKKDSNPVEQPIVIGGKGSDNVRVTLIYNVIDGVLVKKHIWGFGAGNIETYIKSIGNTNGIYNVHNFWFEVMGNFGIFMFIYVIYIYICIVLKNLKIYYYDKSDNDFIDLICVIMMFSFIFLSFAPSSVRDFAPFWILVGISLKNISNYDKMSL